MNKQFFSSDCRELGVEFRNIWTTLNALPSSFSATRLRHRSITFDTDRIGDSERQMENFGAMERFMVRAACCHLTGGESHDKSKNCWRRSAAHDCSNVTDYVR
jgi:hypothetical protein